MPLVIGETFGENSGPWRPTSSEPRPARPTIAPKIGMSPGPVGHRLRGSNGAPNCSSNHPHLPNTGFDGSRTNGIAVAAQTRPPNMGASA